MPVKYRLRSPHGLLPARSTHVWLPAVGWVVCRSNIPASSQKPGRRQSASSTAAKATSWGTPVSPVPRSPISCLGLWLWDRQPSWLEPCWVMPPPEGVRANGRRGNRPRSGGPSPWRRLSSPPADCGANSPQAAALNG